jgi:hypothetical protein
MLPSEVFVSHSSQDTEFAARIIEVMRAHGIPAFYSPHNILGAQQWHDEIGDALARCDWFLLLLSPDAVGSKWVKRELMYALRSDSFLGIVPLMYRDCDYESLSWTLADFQMVDFRGELQEGCRNLLRIWGVGLKSK